MSDTDNMAMDLIRDEMAKNHDRPEIVLLGEYLTERLQKDPGLAAAVLQHKAPLAAGFDAIRDHARKIARNGSACVDDRTGFALACKKWGIPADGDAQALAHEQPGSEPGGVDALDLDALLALGV